MRGDPLKTTTLGTVILAFLLLLSGCLEAGAFRVEVATHYDPDYTRSRDQECGLEAGAAASGAEMNVVLFRRDNRSPAGPEGSRDQTADDVAAQATSEPRRDRGTTLRLSKDADRAEFLFNLTARGGTMFRVEEDEDLWLTLRVAGGRTDDTDCCDRRYSGSAGQPVTFQVTGDETVQVPFGIRCAEQDVQ